MYHLGQRVCVCVIVGGKVVYQPLAQASVLAAPSNGDRVSLCLPGSTVCTVCVLVWQPGLLPCAFAQVM